MIDINPTITVTEMKIILGVSERSVYIHLDNRQVAEKLTGIYNNVINR